MFFSICFLKSTAHAQFCNLSITSNGTHNQGCSAVLIAPKTLITAGHCFPQTFNFNNGLLTGECKYQNQFKQFDSVENINSVQKIKSYNGISSEDDLAIIELKNELFKIEKIKIPIYSALYFDGHFLKKGTQCFASGQNYKIEAIPSQSRLIVFTEEKNGETLKLDRANQYLTYGDSGGGLFCRINSSSPFELIGITSKVGIYKNSTTSDNNIFTSLFSATAQKFIKDNLN